MKPQPAGAPAPERDGLPPGRRRIAYLSLAFATFMAVLDGSIANTALPQIARDLHASPTESIWVINAFQLAVVSSILPFAALGQLYGPARIYRIGVPIFMVGSLLSALAKTLAFLVVARALQGIGAAAIMAIGPALLREVFPKAQLGRALGINTLVVSSSLASGPSLGGFVLAIAPWPWLFLINIPLGLGNIAFNRALPPDITRPGRLDLASVATSALGFSFIIWALDGFARHDGALLIVVRLAIGIALMVWFARRQFRLPRPMISLDLFRIPAFSSAAVTSFATFTAQGLAFVTLPFYFQVALGKTPLESGLLLTSWPLAIAIVAPFAGRLSDRYPVGILATAGLAVVTLGLGMYAATTGDANAALIVVHGAVTGIGVGFFQSPNNRELIGSAPREKSSSAGGLLAAIRTGGQTLGATACAIVFGLFGAETAIGTAAQSAVQHAVPATLWISCGCAGLATCLSAVRLLPVARGVRRPA